MGSMGFKVGDTDLPDPTSFSGQTSDLDLAAERDTTGLLHRDWVAQKVPQEITYTNIPYSTITTILGLLNAPSFSWTFPDPNTGSARTGTFYCGDRKWEVVYAPTGGWIGNLSFNVIEY